MPRKKAPQDRQLALLDIGEEGRTAICVPKIKQEVRDWRDAGKPGITKTTKALFRYWFETEHRTPDGRKFAYYDAQRHAIETLVYLFEVKKIRRRKDLLVEYHNGQAIQFPEVDDYARYALKMATGSGKTKVMALALAWQFFNSVCGEGAEYANTFLLIAPNIIVLERLKMDFESGRVFQTDPIIPPEFKLFWDFDVYVRGDAERTRSEGALYLTNIQQLYDREPESAPANPVEDLLGPAPPKNLQTDDKFIDRIIKRGNCMVINDEAHHTNDDAPVWNQTLVDLNAAIQNGADSEQAFSQLDFSATPRQQDGSLFSWTVFDYPLKQAIIDDIVKRPLKGVPHGIVEQQSNRASVRFEAYIVAAVERWLEYIDQMKDLGKRPVLFFMLGDTKEAEDVALWLRTKYPESFTGDQLLVIHTDKKGEISKKDLEVARVAAREVDNDTSPINCIVSVLMLREGWDVNNVTVVAGLRSFTSKANILPEQAIGRGLRKMFRGVEGYKEHVDIIGNPNFMQIVDDLERQEGITLGTFDYGKKKSRLVIHKIQVDESRVEKYDIARPVMTPRIERLKEARKAIEAFDVGKIRLNVPLKLDSDIEIDDSFTYEGRDVISDELVVERQFEMPKAQSPGEVIAYYSQVIAAGLKLPTVFSILAPKIEQFLREKIFGEEVDLESKAALQALNENRVLGLTEKVFYSVLRPRIIEEHTPKLQNEMVKLSDSLPFPFSGKVVESNKTIFNLTPCANDFEMEFVRFLDNANDIHSFANLGNLSQRLSIEFIDGETNLRFYEPDFIAVANNGIHWLLETKGREDVDVQHKSARAVEWCEDATRLTGTEWRFLLVPQRQFEKYTPTTFSDLVSTLTSGGVLFVEAD